MCQKRESNGLLVRVRITHEWVPLISHIFLREMWEKPALAHSKIGHHD